MRERGILMSAPNVRAILSGTKTQTRRVWKMPRGCDWYSEMGGEHAGWFVDHGQPWWLHVTESRCPYGAPGDRLWVRETWMDLRGTGIEPFTAARTHYAYGADTPPGSYGDECRKEYGLKWRPSIHMPRLACRIVLEITEVRVERLQEISEADAIAEGVHSDPRCRQDDDTSAFSRIGPMRHNSFPIARYAALWDSINGKPHIQRDDAGREISRIMVDWNANPWVWALSFRRIGDA